MKDKQPPHPYKSWTEFLNDNPMLLEPSPSGPFTQVIIKKDFTPHSPDTVLLFDLLMSAAKEKPDLSFTTKELECIFVAMDMLYQNDIHNPIRHRPAPVVPLIEKIRRLIRDRLYRDLHD